MKYRYLTLIALFAVILLLWLTRTQILQIALVSSLEDAGLSQVDTEISQLSTTQLSIPSLQFTLQNDDSQLKLRASEVDISYSPDQLRQGGVNTITIAKLELEHQGNQNSPLPRPALQQTIYPLKIIVAVKRALTSYMVFNRLDIDQLSFQGETFSMLEAMQFNLHSTKDKGALYFQLSELDQSSSGTSLSTRQLVISKPEEDVFLCKLKFTSESVPHAMQLKLNFDSEHITGKYSINAPQLETWLSPFVREPISTGLKLVSGNLDFDFSNSGNMLTTVTAKTDQLAAQSYTFKQPELKLVLQNSSTLPVQHIKLLEGSYINTEKISHQETIFSINSIGLSGVLNKSDANWQYNGKLSSDLVSSTYQSQTVNINALSINVQANPYDIDADGQFSLLDIPGSFMFSIKHNIGSQAGQLSVRSSENIDLNAKDTKLSQITNIWTYPFDLLAGDISLTASSSWSKGQDLSLASHIKLNNIGGHFKELIFSGLSFEHELAILPIIQSVKKSRITLEHLDSGVSINNLDILLSLKTKGEGLLPQFNIVSLSGEIFDGTINGNDFVFDLNKQKNSFSINANDIDLAKIIETQQFEDIEVTGKVDGVIPVEVTDQGASIENGAFINDIQSGIIKYNPAAGTDQLRSNPLTGIALDTLKDFRYSHLSAAVDFAPEGTLTVNLKLKGTSPELDTDRPVHLNINTEQNLFALLKSLRFAQGISDSIDNKVRDQYEKDRGTN